MKGRINITIAAILVAILIIPSISPALDSWQAPFDSTDNNSKAIDSVLTLDDALGLVASENATFRAFDSRLRAAKGDLKQAGVWANPELGVEFEEVGWDAPGFKESEFSVSLAQEFELFGQRGARKKVARALIDAAELSVKVSTFDLYLETKRRFYELAHAQKNVILFQKSVELAKEIVENINYRVERGASLESELLLAQLEKQRAQLAYDQATLDVVATEAKLISLWGGELLGVKLSIGTESDLELLSGKIAFFSNHIDSTRDIMQKQSELNILRAEKANAIAEARPAVTLNGGFKRLAADNSRSFLFGVSLPIPLFNRNQGTQKSIDAQLRSIEYELEQDRIDAISNIKFHTIRFQNLANRHKTLDSLILPTAEKAYRTLQQAYEAGRVSFTHLLEAERALNDLNFEHNDILLTIHEQIIALESLTGVTLHISKEN